MDEMLVLQYLRKGVWRVGHVMHGLVLGARARKACSLNCLDHVRLIYSMAFILLDVSIKRVNSATTAGVVMRGSKARMRPSHSISKQV